MTPRIHTTGRDSFTPPPVTNGHVNDGHRYVVHGPLWPQTPDDARWLAIRRIRPYIGPPRPEDRGWTWLAGYALVLIGAVIGVGLYGWTW